MFEGLFFQFPKLGFLLFFYLGCEALCPLRSNPLYFPRVALFAGVGVKSPLWLWIAKWGMITSLIIAVMSPVRQHPVAVDSAEYDILLVVDPAAVDEETVSALERFVRKRDGDRIGVWVPERNETLIPMTREYGVLVSMIRQIKAGKSDAPVTKSIERFYADSAEAVRWALIVSNDPKRFVYALPTGIQVSVVSPAADADWVATADAEHPRHEIRPVRYYFDFYYLYPLFIGFLFMLAYLYGRNQKGLR